MKTEDDLRETTDAASPRSGPLQRIAAFDFLARWKSKPSWLGPVTPVTFLIAAIMTLGVYVRAKEYFADRTLWIDEARLAINIAGRGFRELLQQLDLHQAAPYGFLYLEKIATLVLGNSGRAFRLFPFVASLLTLPLFYAAGRRILGVRGAVIALFLLVISPLAIRHSVEVKQYGFDLLATIVVLHAAAVYVTGTRRRAGLFWLAIAGSVTLLFSHAVMYVTLSVGLALLGRELIERRSLSPGLAIAGSFVFLAAIANYFLVLKPLLEVKGPHHYWTPFYLPSTRESGYLAVVGESVLQLFDKHLGLRSAGLGAAVFMIGLIASVLRRQGVWAWSVAFPIVLLVMTASLQIYPFEERFLPFTLPMLALGVAAGLEGLISASSRRHVWPVWICFGLGWLLAALVVGTRPARRFEAAVSGVPFSIRKSVPCWSISSRAWSRTTLSSIISMSAIPSSSTRTGRPDSKICGGTPGLKPSNLRTILSSTAASRASGLSCAV